MNPNANQKDSLTISVRCGSGYIRVPAADCTNKFYTDTKEPIAGDKNKTTSQKQTAQK